MNILKQAWTEMRVQPLISGITVAGTAMAICLIMMMVTIEQVKVMPVAPESHRDRFLHNKHLCLYQISNKDNTASSYMSREAADALFMNLESAESATTYCNGYGNTLQVPQGIPFDAGINETDENYWKVFDFTFIAGEPYTEKSLPNSIVLTEETARKLFGSTEKAIGCDVLVDHFSPYTVVGVVKNVPIIASTTYGHAWIPITDFHSAGYISALGDFNVTILARDKADFPAIRKEIAQRKALYDTKIKATGYETDLLEGPFTQEVLPYKKWSNAAPDIDTPRRQRIIIFVILLIIPAINLSSMTQSRLRRRVSEIGVRRAFGCTRNRLIRNILAENFIVTLAGGILGLLLSLLCGWLFADTLMLDFYVGDIKTNVNIWMLLNWQVLLWTVGFCFVLNLLSSGVPAWRASRISPVEAIK